MMGLLLKVLGKDETTIKEREKAEKLIAETEQLVTEVRRKREILQSDFPFSGMLRRPLREVYHERHS